MPNNGYVIAAPVCLLLGALAFADDEAEQAPPYDADLEAKRCLNISSIRTTDVLDDNNIVFEVRGSKVYLNVLPRGCPGLSRERRFGYTTSMSSLCRGDMIRVLQTGGLGIQEGRACTLGEFHPTTKEDLAAYENRKNAPPEAREPSTPEPEEIVPDDDPDDDEEPG